MMLDSNAETLHRAELPEVLELLPVYTGKRVCGNDNAKVFN